LSIGITDECYAYGELDHEIFAAMYLRVTSVFGERPKGVFYDLGCGVGTLVREQIMHYACIESMVYLRGVMGVCIYTIAQPCYYEVQYCNINLPYEIHYSVASITHTVHYFR
jgi:hypothetical protein